MSTSMRKMTALMIASPLLAVLHAHAEHEDRAGSAAPGNKMFDSIKALAGDPNDLTIVFTFVAAGKDVVEEIKLKRRT